MRKKYPYPFVLVHSIILSFLLTIHASTMAQTQPDDAYLQEFFERAAEQRQPEDNETSSWLSDLAFFNEHPVSLNDAKKEDLQALHLLTDIQINNLFLHIEKNGKLMIIYELQAIEGFDLITIQKLLPYVTVYDHSDSPRLTGKELLKGEHVFLLRGSQVLEKQAGFRSIDSLALFKNPNSRYIGSPQKIYVNYRYTCKRTISFGITAEKDPGELFFKRNQKATYPWYTHLLDKKQHNGFDFYSAYLFFHDLKMVKALAIGDYVLTFGQGLTLWNGTSIGTTDMLYIKKNAAGIKPSTSSDENRFMRGIATSIQVKKFCISVFYSRKAIDAHISDTLNNGQAAAVSSLQQTGLHSIPSEIANKHTVVQTIYGSAVSYSQKRLTLGITALSEDLSLPFQHKTPAYTNSETGKMFHMGMDYHFIIHNAQFFGEASHPAKGGMAFLNGLFICLDPRLSFTALHRYYASDYENRFSAGFSESGASHEKGLYLGITANIHKAVQVNAGIDRFEFPRPVFQADAPSYGNDLNFQCRYSPSKRLIITLRIRHLHQEKNTQQTVPMKSLVARNSLDYRFNLDYELTPAIHCRNRIELLCNHFESIHQSGYLIYQDILYNRPGKPFSATLRYALFETNGYESRLYAYENDLPGSYSVPAYYDRGIRFYILVNYSFTKHLECWLRYSRTVYDNKDVISEDTLSEITGNTKSELKIQIKVKL